MTTDQAAIVLWDWYCGYRWKREERIAIKLALKCLLGKNRWDAVVDRMYEITEEEELRERRKKC